LLRITCPFDGKENIGVETSSASKLTIACVEDHAHTPDPNCKHTRPRSISIFG
jgi:hypothetical protein